MSNLPIELTDAILTAEYQPGLYLISKRYNDIWQSILHNYRNPDQLIEEMDGTESLVILYYDELMLDSLTYIYPRGLPTWGEQLMFVVNIPADKNHIYNRCINHISAPRVSYLMRHQYTTDDPRSKYIVYNENNQQTIWKKIQSDTILPFDVYLKFLKHIVRPLLEQAKDLLNLYAQLPAYLR
jgi:hypothetical protein